MSSGVSAYAMWGRAAVLGMLGLLLAGCHGGDKSMPKAPIPEVTVLQVSGQTTPVYTDLVGFVKPYKQVDLRSQVNGILEKISFSEGQMVKKGELLFEIDPRPLQAALDNAKANLASAEANLIRAEQDVVRYQPLLADNAIPRQTYDLAVAQQKQGRAAVEASKAAVESAQLQLNYSRIVSPVNGQIGLRAIDAGSYVAAGQTVLATVTTLDPVYIYFSIPETSVLQIKQERAAEIKAGRGDPARQPIHFILPNGTAYKQEGKIDFASPTIDPETGTLTLRAVFPNPNNLLQTGMTGLVRVKAETVINALLVPQRAVTELLGRSFLTVLDNENKAEQRPVEMGAKVGDMWIVSSGIKAGDRIVVDGLQKARPGAEVKPVMMTAQQLDASKGLPGVTVQ